MIKMYLRCNSCGKQISNQLPDDTIVRGWIECPECIKKQKADDIFIQHIQNHLLNGQEVICKICGKTAKEIINESWG